MKILFIGGTGNISQAVSEATIAAGIDLYLLNRGRTGSGISGARSIVGDISNPGEISRLLADQTWDVVVDWIAFTEKDVLRDIELFRSRTKQYIFISSASVYQKPLSFPVITESTPLANPFWQYSRNKIACELILDSFYRQEGFPVTIVRPSLTYYNVIPVTIGGWQEYTVVERMKKGKKIIVHGDGTSLWTVTHAEDFARGILGLFGHQQAIGQAFHITSDEILTWDQIHHALAAAVDCEPNIVHIPSDLLAAYDDRFTGSLIGDKATSVIFDNTKIKRFVPGFKAVIPFRQGIRRTLEWFGADPARRIVRRETDQWMDRIIERYERAYPASGETFKLNS